MWRVRLGAFVAGTAFVHLWAALPPRAWAMGVLLASLAAMGVLRSVDAGRRWSRVWWPVLFACVGVASTAWRAELRLHDALSPDLENKPLQVRFQVTGLATRQGGGQRFEAELLDAPAGVPRKALLSWYPGDPRRQSTPDATVMPGQVWRARVSFKRPHANLNPHGFDAEAHMFQRGIRVQGNLRGAPRREDDAPWAGFDIAVQRARHHLRAGMQPALTEARYGAVIMALAMGDQAAVDRRDWTVFNRTGITHLVSISGLHVTLVAALGGSFVGLLWARAAWRGLRLAERCPAQVAAASAALVVAWLYCLVAGWGIPAQRTFFMLAVVAGAAALRVPLSASRVLVLGAALVCVLDPWAPVAAGFWLSFGAVAMLISVGAGRWRRRPDPGPAGWRQRWRGWRDRLLEAARLQGAITIGLLPLLGLLFQQVSLVAPLANAVAIPVVSLLVTPLALAAMFVGVVPGLEGVGAWPAWAAHQAFAWTMVPIEAMSAWPASNAPLAAAPWPWVVLAAFGALWCLQPRGLPGRALALCLLVPMLVYRPARPLPGEWRLVALDVGQGGAVVVETATATLLFDTGPGHGAGGDAGERVVWPYLRSRGIGALDELVLSHGDLDHAGGLRSIVAALPVRAMRASYPVRDATAAEGGWSDLPAVVSLSRCYAGQAWSVDDVTFRVVWPVAPSPGDADPGRGSSRERNENGCVVRLEGRYHRALLTGDIGAPQEQVLVARGLAPAEVVTAPHHGSRNSSSLEFVEAVRATHVVAQAGYLNSYRHPHPLTVARWEAAGATLHRSDRDGAVILTSSASGLTATRERVLRRRYWHHPPASGRVEQK